MTRGKKIGLIAGTLILALIGIFVMLVLSTTYGLGVSNVKQGSLAYRMGIPDFLKDIPLHNPCREAVYTFEGRDGERVPFGEVHYGTSEQTAPIMTAYAAYLTSYACTIETRYSILRADNCAQSRFRSADIRIQNNDGACRLITISTIGD
jgi:hypothetical protein